MLDERKRVKLARVIWIAMWVGWTINMAYEWFSFGRVSPLIIIIQVIYIIALVVHLTGWDKRPSVPQNVDMRVVFTLGAILGIAAMVMVQTLPVLIKILFQH